MLRGTENLIRGKLGVSIMIGYILLISLAVIMGGVIYAWMKSYVPQDKLECPEGTSISIKSYEYNCSTPEILNITIKNNGRFDIAGYFIHASDRAGQSIANLDLSKNLTDTGGVFKYQNSITLSSGNNNSFVPNLETQNVFNTTGSGIGELKLIEITPVRWQKDSNNKLRFVSCGENSRAKEAISCG